MSLPAGTRIGQYEISSVLGAGGMGEVYRARDSKLNRDVALKVLPDLLANDPDRVARFRREAQLLAALNHPNIAHIYGFEDAQAATGSIHAIAMELVEGPTLADRIAGVTVRSAPAAVAPSESASRGATASGGGAPRALSIDDILPIARQIADALETAHDQGIVHRDLKPANIKVRDDGTVKVLDFGLAKALSTDAGAVSGEASNSPTLTARGTQIGTILGTAAYMAPEQARGRSVDRRADIWAFGVVLYEMLSGKRAFEGEDVSITLASVLKEDVDWQALPPDLPAPLHRLLRRCLEKDPKRRLSAIGDARLELDDAASAPSVDTTAVAAATATAATALANLRRSVKRAWMTVGAIAAVAAMLLVANIWWPGDVSTPVQRAQFSVPETIGVTGQSAPSLSPDGRMLAFVSRSRTGGVNQIFVRPIDSLEARAIPGTDAPGGLFWIDGSKAIGFIVGIRIYRVGIDGGAPQPLCEMSSFAGATWLDSGEILVAQFGGANAKLFRVPGLGGAPVEVARQKNNEPSTAFVGPAALPGGRFLYLGWSTEISERALYAGSLDGAPPVRLVASDSVGAYAEPGFLLFMRAGTLFAQRFDASSLTVSGDPVRIADDVAFNAINGRASFGVSQTGVLAYRTAGGAAGMADLAWLDRTGKALGTVGDARNYYQIRLSPDGKRVAVAEAGASALMYRLSVLDLGNGVASGITSEKDSANDPAWSPDADTIAFEAIQKNGRQLYTQRVGSSTATLVFESPDDPKWLDDWSADGKFLLFHLPRPSKLFAVSMQEPRTARLLLETTETIDSAHFSPDGKWISYQVTDAGVYQVWVASFPAFDKRQRVSAQGGGQAFWRGDGRELFYLSPAGKMMSVGVTPNVTTGTLDFAAPIELFQSPIPSPMLSIDQYSVTKDGKRFLFIRPRDTNVARPPVTVVVNWASGLK